MFLINEISNAQHIEGLSLVNDRQALYVVIESNQKDPKEYEARILSKLLLSSLNASSSDNSEPDIVNLAREMADDLERRVEQGGYPTGVFYSGVSLQRQQIKVCTAGDIRVHLIQQDKLIGVTRDHNLLSDGEAQQAEVLKGLPIELLCNTPTRWVGNRCKLRPETLTWDIEGPYSVVLCTSQFHRYRNPEEYLPFFRDGIAGLRAVNSAGAWLACQIDSVIKSQ